MDDFGGFESMDSLVDWEMDESPAAVLEGRTARKPVVVQGAQGAAEDVGACGFAAAIMARVGLDWVI